MKAPPKVTRPAFSPSQKISVVSETVTAPARKSRTAGRPNEIELVRPTQVRALVQTS